MITHLEDVIYGRKFGLALTLDVFTPESPNGLGLIYVVAGGWRSGHDWIGGPENGMVAPFLEKGYTVFATVLSSAPKFTIPELVDDLHRAVRFVRFNAAQYGVDPDLLGIYGASAGGHLSLMIGFAGREGNPEAEDAVERVSSRVQAVAEFYGPSDFINYGGPSQLALGEGLLVDLASSFDFTEFNPSTGVYEKVTREKYAALGQELSPVNLATKDSPPTFLVHGDADERVPLQQSEIVYDKLRALGVPTELVVNAGGAHGWPEQHIETYQMADWFDTHLKQG